MIIRVKLMLLRSAVPSPPPHCPLQVLARLLLKDKDGHKQQGEEGAKQLVHERRIDSLGALALQRSCCICYNSLLERSRGDAEPKFVEQIPIAQLAQQAPLTTAWSRSRG